LRNVAELGTGIAVGHVMGHALENVLFGGRHATPEQLQEAEEKVKKGPCSVQFDAFQKCLKKNEEDAGECDWAFEMFKECQLTNKENVDFTEESKEVQ